MCRQHTSLPQSPCKGSAFVNRNQVFCRFLVGRLSVSASETAVFCKRSHWIRPTIPLISFNHFNGFVQPFHWFCFSKLPLLLFPSAIVTVHFRQFWPGTWATSPAEALYIEHRDTEMQRSCATRKKLCASESLCSIYQQGEQVRTSHAYGVWEFRSFRGRWSLDSTTILPNEIQEFPAARPWSLCLQRTPELPKLPNSLAEVYFTTTLRPFFR